MKAHELLLVLQAPNTASETVGALEIDYAASPTLTTLRDLIGDTLTRKLVLVRGGNDVYLPERATETSALVKIIGLEAAILVIAHFGGHQHIDIPTGRGLAHGRRIDPGRVMILSRQGYSGDQIARLMGCTARQVRNIRAKFQVSDEIRQLKLL